MTPASLYLHTRNVCFGLHLFSNISFFAEPPFHPRKNFPYSAILNPCRKQKSSKKRHLGNDFDDIFQIAICDATYYKPISAYLTRPTISRCDLGKRCNEKTKCQAKCEVVEERECPIQKCVGNNCSSHTTKKDGCVFCDGAWQIEKTDIMVCRSGELLKRSCPADKWCMSQGDCKAHCESVDTNVS
jgi:hypothetical protein